MYKYKEWCLPRACRSHKSYYKHFTALHFNTIFVPNLFSFHISLLPSWWSFIFSPSLPLSLSSLLLQARSINVNLWFIDANKLFYCRHFYSFLLHYFLLFVSDLMSYKAELSVLFLWFLYAFMCICINVGSSNNIVCSVFHFAALTMRAFSAGSAEMFAVVAVINCQCRLRVTKP